MKLLQTSSVDYKLTLSYIKLFILIIITILNFLNLNEAVFSMINSALYLILLCLIYLILGHHVKKQ